MLKNENEISKGHSPPGVSETGKMSAVIELHNGDVVKVRQHATAGSSEIIHGDWSYFSGFLIKCI